MSWTLSLHVIRVSWTLSLWGKDNTKHWTWNGRLIPKSTELGNSRIIQKGKRSSNLIWTLSLHNLKFNPQPFKLISSKLFKISDMNCILFLLVEAYLCIKSINFHPMKNSSTWDQEFFSHKPLENPQCTVRSSFTTSKAASICEIVMNPIVFPYCFMYENCLAK